MSHRPVVPRRPADTLALADAATAVAVAGLGVTAAALLWDRGEAGIRTAPVVFGGWLAGALVLRVHPHRFRVLGACPLAATLATATAAAGWAFGWPDWLAGVFAAFQGAAVGSLLRFRDHFRARFGRFALAALAGAALAAGAVALFQHAGGNSDDWRAAYRGALVGAAGALAAVGCAAFARPAVEMVLDPIARAMYRFRAAGPGRASLPKTGPCLVIANHAAWFDPLFVAEAVHRETTPMMTAGFYDLPFMRWLMRRVFRVIRVPDQGARRDAPEIRDAVAALDAGQCVVIFPEGYLRRKDDTLLKRFGQGVWQILRDRPGTPVVACWIEGTWGSYFSHFNGPPTKNKKRDLRRPIRVGVSDPVGVPADVLADHLTARVWLMNRVLEARAHLGLDPGPAVELPARGEE